MPSRMHTQAGAWASLHPYHRVLPGMRGAGCPCFLAMRAIETCEGFCEGWRGRTSMPNSSTMKGLPIWAAMAARLVV